MIKATFALLAGCLALSACAPSYDGYAGGGGDYAYGGCSNGGNTLAGVGIGAVGGGLLGNVLGGRRGSTGRTLAGALAGGLAGGLVGNATERPCGPPPPRTVYVDPAPIYVQPQPYYARQPTYLAPQSYQGPAYNGYYDRPRDYGRTAYDPSYRY